MIKFVISKLAFFDSKVTDYIDRFLAPYLVGADIPFLAARLHLFIKTALYSAIILIPFLFLKFLYPEDNKISYAIFIILCLTGLGVILTFLGFFQMLFA